MTQDLALVEKQLDSSVQARADITADQLGGIFWLTMWRTAEEVPKWWSPERDRYLRDFWPCVPLLADTVSTFVSRLASLPWKIEGPPGRMEEVDYYQSVLHQAEFGAGWGTFVQKFILDYLTQDNGAFAEVIRPASASVDGKIYPAAQFEAGRWALYSDGAIRHKPRGKKEYRLAGPGWIWADEVGEIGQGVKIKEDKFSRPIGLAHLDAARCYRTGDALHPVRYYNDYLGKDFLLENHQVYFSSWLPSTMEEFLGVGYSPISLCLTTSQILQHIEKYTFEKVSGRFFKRLIIINNLQKTLVEDALAKAESMADMSGLTHFVRNALAFNLDTEREATANVVDLAGLPDDFDREKEFDIAADLITAAFGLDRPEVIPMRTATLGQAGQVGVMHLKAKGKGLAQGARVLERFINLWVLPEGLTFQFDFQDDEEDRARAELKKLEAETIIALHRGGGLAAAAGEIGLITHDEARKMLNMAGILPDDFLTVGEEEAGPAQAQEEGKKKLPPDRKQLPVEREPDTGGLDLGAAWASLSRKRRTRLEKSARAYDGVFAGSKRGETITEISQEAWERAEAQEESEA